MSLYPRGVSIEVEDSECSVVGNEVSVCERVNGVYPYRRANKRWTGYVIIVRQLASHDSP